MKVTHILGCGPSGSDYKPDGNEVIGVNDSYKFGHTLTGLFLINSPRQFDLQRLGVIMNTSYHRLIVLESLWDSWKAQGIIGDEVIRPKLFPGNHNIRQDEIYFTNNSPFTAMTYAVTKGATDVILHGTDFEGHRFLRFQDCAPEFTRYAQWCRPKGIRIYKGSKQSRLVLEIWNGNN